MSWPTSGLVIMSPAQAGKISGSTKVLPPIANTLPCKSWVRPQPPETGSSAPMTILSAALVGASGCPTPSMTAASLVVGSPTIRVPISCTCCATGSETTRSSLQPYEPTSKAELLVRRSQVTSEEPLRMPRAFLSARSSSSTTMGRATPALPCDGITPAPTSG